MFSCGRTTAEQFGRAPSDTVTIGVVRASINVSKIGQISIVQVRLARLAA